MGAEVGMGTAASSCATATGVASGPGPAPICRVVSPTSPKRPVTNYGRALSSTENSWSGSQAASTSRHWRRGSPTGGVEACRARWRLRPSWPSTSSRLTGATSDKSRCACVGSNSRTWVDCYARRARDRVTANGKPPRDARRRLARREPRRGDGSRPGCSSPSWCLDASRAPGGHACHGPAGDISASSAAGGLGGPFEGGWNYITNDRL